MHVYISRGREGPVITHMLLTFPLSDKEPNVFFKEVSRELVESVIKLHSLSVLT